VERIAAMGMMAVGVLRQLETRRVHRLREQCVQVFERFHSGYGIAVLRIMVGIVLFLAGWAKMMGPGVAGITGFFANVGIPMAPVMAPLVIGFEVIGGLMLIVGLFTRFIGPIMIVQFLVAGLMVTLPSQQGWSAARLDFLLAAAGALFLMAGAGALSVDGWLASRSGGRSGQRASSFA
jgi:putative oxidoreductase